MNIAVLGKGKINSILKSQFAIEGITILEFEDADKIVSVSGERGNFKVKGRDGSYDAVYLIVTEEPSFEHESITGQKGVISLDEDTELDLLPFSNAPVVFILDYPEESPNFMTRHALEKAIKLAKRKRNVLYLARFMRTAGDGLELLYKEARNSGVAFFKYDSISIGYSSNEEKFHITASDGLDSLKVSTQTPVLAGKSVYSSAFLRIIKLLKLRLNSTGQVNGDSFFLFPSHTSRRGIYFINMKTTSGSESELISQIQYIISDIKSDLQVVSKADISNSYKVLNSEEYAEVDSEKCAFCYTCYRACPHFAMAPDYENSAMKNLNASCSGCGICFSVCPANAISMVRKTAKDEKPAAGSLKVFCCENSGEIALQSINKSLGQEGLNIEMTAVSCGGELSADVIISALKNFDKVLVAVCMDDACKHFEGNKRAKRYVERAKEMLKASGIDENRIVYMQLSHAMPITFSEHIKEML